MCVLPIKMNPEVEAKILLTEASALDFKKLLKYKELSNGEYAPVFVYRFGIPFWLKSMVTDEIEANCNIFSEETNKEDFKEWLDHKMVYIPINLKQYLDTGRIIID